MGKTKPESMLSIVVYWLFFAAIFLGASSGCVTDETDDRNLIGACALMGLCIVLYAVKCFAMRGDERELDS